MEPDTAPRRLDHVERAHLRSPGDASHVMYRYDAAPEFAGLLERFWLPVWSVPPGREAPQQVLQYPVTLLVVSGDYARFYGVVSGLSTTTLTGDGWAVGVMCAPAAGALVARGSVASYTDRHVPLAEVLGAEGERLTVRVRTAMAADPTSPAAHALAMAAFGDALRPLLPVDAEGALANRGGRVRGGRPRGYPGGAGLQGVRAVRAGAAAAGATPAGADAEVAHPAPPAAGGRRAAARARHAPRRGRSPARVRRPAALLLRLSPGSPG